MTEPTAPQLVPTSSHRWRATVFFGLSALVWTVLLGEIVAFSSSHDFYVVLWCGSAIALWFLLLGDLQNTARPALPIAFKWWVLTLGGPFGVAYVLKVRHNSAPSSPPAQQSAQASTSKPADLVSRVAFLERRVAELQTIVEGLQAGRATAPSREAAPPPTPRWEEPAPPPPPRPQPPLQLPPRPAPAAAAPLQPKVSTGFDWGRTMSATDLMGAKALAFAGGVVTLLGVVFFFVLAVNRGWVGPGMRVTFGGLASAAVLCAGLWLRRRYGETYSSLAAAGAGIAGGYATLLAATALYDLVAKPVALVVATLIAAAGVAVSLAWRTQTVAAIGLVGATLVPALVAFDGGLTRIGTAFVALVFAAT